MLRPVRTVGREAWRANRLIAGEREVAHSALILTAAMMLLVSIWSAWGVPGVAEHWFAWPNIVALAPVPVITAVVLFALWRRIWTGRDTDTFLLAVTVFLLGFVGLVVSLWPYVVPRHVTIWDGISDPQTLAFIGVGIAIIIPIVLTYQAHAYWVFRGKTRHIDGYGGPAHSASAFMFTGAPTETE
jgi:cytochrome bd ubiquinol oxidase subunit II